VAALRLSLLPLLMALCAADAHAQTNNRFALGLDYIVKTSDRASKEDYAHGQLGPALLWRFGESKPGWGFHWGLNWYAVRLERPIGGIATELGELHVRPVMAGYGYTKRFGDTSVTADVMGGYAIGSIAIADTATDAYRTRLGAPGTNAEASNTIVLKPEIIVWRNLGRKIGLTVNAGYMFARPTITVTNGLATDVRVARADQFIVRVGAVYSIFSSGKSKQSRRR